MVSALSNDQGVFLYFIYIPVCVRHLFGGTNSREDFLSVVPVYPDLKKDYAMRLLSIH